MSLKKATTAKNKIVTLCLVWTLYALDFSELSTSPSSWEASEKIAVFSLAACLVVERIFSKGKIRNDVSTLLLIRTWFARPAAERKTYSYNCDRYELSLGTQREISQACKNGLLLAPHKQLPSASSLAFLCLLALLFAFAVPRPFLPYVGAWLAQLIAISTRVKMYYWYRNEW